MSGPSEKAWGGLPVAVLGDSASLPPKGTLGKGSARRTPFSWRVRLRSGAPLERGLR